MNVRREPWARLLIRTLSHNPEFVKVYVIPGLIFFLDFVLRAVLDVDLIDAGADMALLAVATFMTLLVEDDVPSQQQLTLVSVVFIVIFLVPWIVCLRIIATPQPIKLGSLGFPDFRLILSWLVGLIAFVLSGIIASEIV